MKINKYRKAFLCRILPTPHEKEGGREREGGRKGREGTVESFVTMAVAPSLAASEFSNLHAVLPCESLCYVSKSSLLWMCRSSRRKQRVKLSMQSPGPMGEDPPKKTDENMYFPMHFYALQTFVIIHMLHFFFFFFI